MRDGNGLQPGFHDLQDLVVRDGSQLVVICKLM
jgi:hypothetical protein